MKQVLQSYRSGELWLAEVPAPAAQSGGVVVQTAASLVSAGTERMIIELGKKSLIGKAKARPDLVKQVIAKIKTEGLAQTMSKVFAKLDTPIALGYSCAGTASEVGAGVSGIQVGDRVACGGAGYATHAQYNFVPKNLCVKIPESVSFEDACFTTLGAIAMQGVRQADPRLGERVAVIGLGLLGLLTVQLLKAAGCVVIGSDLDPDKCALTKQLGADDAVSGGLPQAVGGLTDGYGVDAVIITAATASNGPIETAAEICRPKGRVVVVGVVGMDVPRDPFYKKELDLRLSMSYGPGRYDPSYEEGGHDYPFHYVRWTQQRNMASFLELIAAGRVTPSKLITHRYDIDQALGAYELLEGKGPSQGQEKYLGIVVGYPSQAREGPPVRKVTLQSVAAASSASGREGIGVGFVGAGNFAKAVLLPVLKRIDGTQLVGVCTATGNSASETGKKHGFAYATTDWKQLLHDDKINAIFIVTQHNTHAQYALDALAAGKHVFVEKPLCIKPEDLDRYRKVLQDAPQPPPCLMVGFNRRFSSHAVAIKDAFASRSTPLVVSYRVNAGVVPRDVWLQDPEIGGGRILGEVCHFVDFPSFVSGSNVTGVFATCVSTDDSRLVSEDSVVITLNYADGSLATIQYLAHGSSQLPKERVEVCADGVTAVTDNFTKTVFYGTRRPAVKGAQDKGFDAELNAFMRTVRNGGPWPISLESMLGTTGVTFAINESLRTGRPVSMAGFGMPQPGGSPSP